MKSILDPSFRYHPSFDTDLKRTFARVRERQNDAEQAAQATSATLIKISPIVSRAATGR